jgi:hypothetical protein
MKKGAPIIIGIVVFVAILVGWFLTLPGTLKRASGGSYGTLTGITSEGLNLFSGIKDAQTNMGKGVATMNDIIVAAYKNDAAIADLKSKIETKQKIKAALMSAPDTKPPLNEPAKP